jgi:hypothetical protein
MMDYVYQRFYTDFSKDELEYVETPEDIILKDGMFIHDPCDTKMGEDLQSILQDSEWQFFENDASSFCEPGDTYCFDERTIYKRQGTFNNKYEVQFVIRLEENRMWTRHLYIIEEYVYPFRATWYHDENEE